MHQLKNDRKTTCLISTQQRSNSNHLDLKAIADTYLGHIQYLKITFNFDSLRSRFKPLPKDLLRDNSCISIEKETSQSGILTDIMVNMIEKSLATCI